MSNQKDKVSQMWFLHDLGIVDSNPVSSFITRDKKKNKNFFHRNIHFVLQCF
jgi:hypothetical protein